MDGVVARSGKAVDVAVVGCGSIGRRHIANLAALEKVGRITVATRDPRCLEGFEHDRRITAVGSPDDLTADIAVIANDTARHADTAALLAGRGMHLFIEKPVAITAGEAETIRSAANDAGVKVQVGYNLRFLGIMDRLRTLLAERTIGTLYFARIEAGQYLPDWRPGTDYRRSYSASAARGGGVALDLSHEIDYMRWLFGDPVSWRVMKTRVSDLEIDSDDLFEGIYRYAGNFLCTVHLDYLQPRRKRQITITGSTGTILCDLAEKRLVCTVNGRGTTYDDEGLFDLAKTYRDELRHFIRAVREDRKPMISLDDGIRALRLLEDGHV